jgi:integrase/recombinase XerD
MGALTTTPNQAFALALNATLPPSLDGSSGDNRGVGRQQIAANTDWEAIRVWLRQFADQEKTYAAYEKEVVRFYVWVLASLGKPLSSVVFEDWEAYLSFLADPQPRSVWVGTKRGRHTKDGALSKDYRPFAGPLAPSSVRFAHGIIWAMFEWLRSVGYLAGNPIIVNRRRLKKSKRSQSRFLDEDQWRAVLDSIEELPQRTDKERKIAARWRWAVTLFYMTGIRTAEALNATMGSFSVVRDRAENRDRHFLTVIGKGDKERSIPIVDAFLPEIPRFRKVFGLSEWPAPHETTPLVFSLRAKTAFRPLTRQTMWALFKEIFSHAAAVLEQVDPQRAAGLKAASTHWMRHTAATDMLDAGADLRTVQAILGHESLATTSIYSHTEDLKLHRDLSDKHKIQRDGQDQPEHGSDKAR